MSEMHIVDDGDEEESRPHARHLRSSQQPLIIEHKAPAQAKCLTGCISLSNILTTMFLAVIGIVIYMVAKTNWLEFLGLDGAQEKLDAANAELQEANENMEILQGQLDVLQANITTLIGLARECQKILPSHP